jgi:hypothetical protein
MAFSELGVVMNKNLELFGGDRNPKRFEFADFEKNRFAIKDKPSTNEEGVLIYDREKCEGESWELI